MSQCKHGQNPLVGVLLGDAGRLGSVLLCDSDGALTVIDIHAHAIVPDGLEEMAAAHPDHAPVLEPDGENTYLAYPGRERLGPLPTEIFDPGMRLAAMDRLRVDVQVIAIPPPQFHYHVPADVGRDFARIQNDALAALADQQPDRFHFLGTLPLLDFDGSLEEITRVGAHPLLRGFQLGSNVNGVDYHDPSFDPLWEALAEGSFGVLIHPDQRSIAGADRIGEFYLQNLIGLPLESTITMASLIFGGVLERYPDLRFGFVHGGGFAPYQTGRWDHGWEVRTEPKAHISRPPSEYFARFFFDTLTHDAVSLRLLAERVGWDHVMLGSDFPFDMAATDPVGAVEAVTTDPLILSEVFATNAGRFLRPVGG